MQNTKSKPTQKSLTKQADTQFVCKLCDMMQKYPQIINWDSQGQKMIVFNTQKMQQIVLPQYFRHNNFASFIRQLNMYNYHKLQKSELYDNDFIVFQHEIFRRGNERNFHFIQRKKRIKQQQQMQYQFQKKNQQLLSKLNDQEKLSQKTKDSIQSLLEFKFIATEHSRKMKEELENVHRELKDCRSKKISQAVRQITDKISEEIAQQLEISRMVDHLLESSFLAERQKKPIFTNLIGSYYPTMLTDQTYYPMREMMYDRNCIQAKLSYLPLQSQCRFFSQMSFTDPVQTMHPLFYSNPQFFSDMNFGQVEKIVEKKEEPQDDDNQDSFIKNMIREEELQNILCNQKEKIAEDEKLKKEEF